MASKKLERLKQKRDALINQYRETCNKVQACSHPDRFLWLVGKRESIGRSLLATEEAIKNYVDIPAEKKERINKCEKPTVKAKRITRAPSEKFYLSREWRELRYRALENTNGKCQACGASAKDGIQLHVDHIKPRSRHPHLALELSNLQVLCEDCNLGKSNIYETDWRGLKGE